MNFTNDPSLVEERRHQCLKLRQMGLTYRQIAKETGLGLKTAHKYVAKSVDEIREKCDEIASNIIAIELDRLDLMFQNLWDRIERGDSAAMLTALKIMDRRAKYLGLDSPTKIAETNVAGEDKYAAMSDDELKALLADLNDKINNQPTITPAEQ